MICLDQELFLAALSGFCLCHKRQAVVSLDVSLKRRVSFFFYTAAINGEIFRCRLFRRPNLYLTVNTTHYSGQSHKCYVRLHLKRLLFLSDFRKS